MNDLVYDCDVYWADENNLVYFAQMCRLICESDSFLGC